MHTLITIIAAGNCYGDFSSSAASGCKFEHFYLNHARWEEKKVHVAMLIFNILLFVIGLAERAQPLNDRASRELGSSSIL